MFNKHIGEKEVATQFFSAKVIIFQIHIALIVQILHVPLYTRKMDEGWRLVAIFHWLFICWTWVVGCIFIYLFICWSSRVGVFFFCFSNVPINRHRQVLALLKESAFAVIWRIGIGKILPIPFNNLAIINCLSWLKSATLELYKTQNNLENTDMNIFVFFLYIHELLDLLLK